MDAGMDSTHNGNGNGSPKPDHPKSASLPSKGPDGAPVKAPTSGASTGTPEIKLTPNQAAFLKALAETAGNVTAAAKSLGMSRDNHSRWKNEQDDEGNLTPRALLYREEAARVDAEALDEVEAEIRRRAVLGVTKPVFYQGEICGHVQEYSDVLLIFRAKALAPHKYRERYEVTGAGGKPLNPEKVDVNVTVNYAEALKTLTDEELEAHNAIAQKLLSRSGGSTPSGSN